MVVVCGGRGGGIKFKCAINFLRGQIDLWVTSQGKCYSLSKNLNLSIFTGPVRLPEPHFLFGLRKNICISTVLEVI